MFRFPRRLSWFAPLAALILATALATGALAEGRQEVPVLLPTADPCAYLTALRANPILVRAAGTVTVNANVSSCSTQDEALTVTVTFDSLGAPDAAAPDCLAGLAPEAASLLLRPRDTRGLSVTRPAPPCPGYYTVAVSLVAADGAIVFQTPAIPLFHRV